MRELRRMKKLITILALMATLSGCLSAVPTQPVTPQNAAQVHACETDETWHNIGVVTGIALGATTTGLGSAGTVVSSDTTRRDLAVSTIITGAVAVVVTAFSGIEAADYSNSGCTVVLGPLPIGKTGEKK